MNGAAQQDQTSSQTAEQTAGPVWDQPAPPAADTAELRARLTRQFESWLDQMLADEAPPPGIPDSVLAEAAAHGNPPAGDALDCDLYTLFSALTSLSGEIRLQGRAFKQLTEAFAPLGETPSILKQLQETQRESVDSITSAIEQRTGQSAGPERTPVASDGQICDLLIDLYDRLARGLNACGKGIESIQAAQRHGWLWRLAGGEQFAAHAVAAMQSLRDACAITLARLAAAMQDWRIERIGEVGDDFDPRAMTVVDVRPTDEAPPGTVIEIIRSGYARDGQVEAVARVAVARPAASHARGQTPLGAED